MPEALARRRQGDDVRAPAADPRRAAALQRVLERRLWGPLEEGEFSLEMIDGELPVGLRGRLLMNGPGRLGGAGERSAWRDEHWLDGDGLLTAIRFGDAQETDDNAGAEASGRRPVTLTQRLVRTRRLEEELEAGEPLFRRFGTSWPGDRLLRGVGIVSPANVSVARLGARLVACGEQGLPWEVDGQTLRTVGPFDAGGALTPVTPFAAHLCRDPESGESFAFGVSFSPRQPLLNLYRFDAGGELASRHRIELPYPASIHDFALSHDFVVFHVSPYCLDMQRLRAGASIEASLDWRPELGSRLLVARRDDAAVVAQAPCGSGYCLHLANAFEPEPGRLVVDLVEYEAPLYPAYRLPRLYDGVPRGVPVRYVLDLERSPTAGLERSELPTSGWAPDFPSVLASRETRSGSPAWMVDQPRTGGTSFFDRLVRVDWDAGETSEYRPQSGYLFAGEPAVVEGPQGPWVLAVVHREPELAALAGTDGEDSPTGPDPRPAQPDTQLWVHDAMALEHGPLARLALPSVPPRFHALYEPRPGDRSGAASA